MLHHNEPNIIELKHGDFITGTWSKLVVGRVPIIYIYILLLYICVYIMHVFVPAPPLFLFVSTINEHVRSYPHSFSKSTPQARHALFAVTVDFIVLIRLRKPASSSPVGKMSQRAAGKSIQQAKKLADCFSWNTPNTVAWTFSRLHGSYSWPWRSCHLTLWHLSFFQIGRELLLQGCLGSTEIKHDSMSQTFPT